MLLAMFGGTEIIIILVVVVLIFGPSKLPQLGSGVGKMLRGFKREMKAIESDDEASGTDRGELDVTPVDKPGEASSKPS